MDENCHFFPEATTFIINGTNLKPLLLLLNSKIISSIFKLYYAGGGLGEKGLRYKKAFILNLRLPRINKTVAEQFNQYYKQLHDLDFKEIDQLSNEIDIFISNLYGFTPAEKNHLLNTL